MQGGIEDRILESLPAGAEPNGRDCMILLAGMHKFEQFRAIAFKTGDKTSPFALSFSAQADI